jgi:diaminohydroxyphosphoribosylaminopyrimidine deaminase/5-amino-6-(5-phosphoribosylamino)uracil reductase
MSKELSNDQKFMGYALRIAKINIGLTAPNPAVGCVIVKDDQIIATAITSKSGRPHAETIAINKIKDKKLLAGATIYVTLEPCCHYGLTPPCSDLIISSKIGRVVIATKDPDQRVDGKSIKQLQDAGIEVVLGIKQKEAKELNRAFFKVKLIGKPYITLKLATSLDGKIATKNYHSKWITGTQSQNFSHYLRSINDCIMVGANTIRQDNPMLNCRLDGLEEHCPIRVVISSSLDFEQDYNIFKSYNQSPTLIFTISNPNQNNLKKLQKIIDQKNIEIIFLPNNQQLKLDLSEVLSNLVKRNINSILVEGGSNLATEFIKQDLVDELIWIKNKKIIGADGISAIGDLGLADVNLAINNFTNSETINYPEDTIEIYKRSSLKISYETKNS